MYGGRDGLTVYKQCRGQFIVERRRKKRKRKKWTKKKRRRGGEREQEEEGDLVSCGFVQ